MSVTGGLGGGVGGSGNGVVLSQKELLLHKEVDVTAWSLLVLCRLLQDSFFFLLLQPFWGCLPLAFLPGVMMVPWVLFLLSFGLPQGLLGVGTLLGFS